MHNVYLKDGTFITVLSTDTQPEGCGTPWEISDDQARYISNGASIELVGGLLTITLAKSVAETVIVDDSSRYLSQTKFLSRLSSDEIRGIYYAADASIDVKIWLDKFKMAQDIWLDHPDLVFGLNSFVGSGILTYERVKEILS